MTALGFGGVNLWWSLMAIVEVFNYLYYFPKPYHQKTSWLIILYLLSIKMRL